MSEFTEGMAEILEIEPDEVTSELSLQDHAWDSLAIVSTIALIDEVYGVAVSPNALLECETIADIEKLVAAAEAEG